MSSLWLLCFLFAVTWSLRTQPFRGYRKFAGLSAGSLRTSWNTGCASDYPSPVPWPDPLPQWFLQELQQLEANITKLVDNDGTASLMVNLVYDQQVVWEFGLGKLNVTDPYSPSPTGDTIYRIGSVSKALTTCEALRLQDEGVVNLDDPVTDLYPQFQMPNPFRASLPITLDLLTSHMAGLPRETPCVNMFSQGCMNTSLDTLLHRMNTDLQLIYPPGWQPSYSNLGFGLLGRAMEKPTGATWEEFFPKGVLAPLGMNSSGWEYTPSVVASMAVGYAGTAVAPLIDIGWESPAGQLYSTTNDLAKFMAMIFNYDSTETDNFLDPQTLREWLEPAHLFGDGTAMGRPWEMYPMGGYMFHSKSGSMPGYNAEFVFAAPIKTGTVLLASDETTAIYYAQGAMSKFIANQVDRLLSENQPAPAYPANAADYLGVFAFAGVGQMTVYTGNLDGYGQALLLRGVLESGVVQLVPLQGQTDAFMMAYGPLAHNCGNEWGGSLQILQFLRTNGAVVAATLPGFAFGLIGHKH